MKLTAPPRWATPIAAVCGIYASLIVPADAYLDPGSGALFVQGIIAAVAGGAIAFRQVLMRTLARLRELGGNANRQDQRRRAADSEDETKVAD